MKPDRLIISRQSVLQLHSFLRSKISSQICVTESKHCKELGEKQNENEVEEQEYLQIKDDICEHDHNRSQSWEDSKEEECL